MKAPVSVIPWTEEFFAALARRLLAATGGDFTDVAVLFPLRRAARHLCDRLAELPGLPKPLLLPEIAAQFELYKAEQEKSVDVEVTSAFALSTEQQDKLAKVLNARLSREVRLHVTEDAALIGGVVIRAGDLVIDGSVRGKIAKLAEALKS